MMKIITIAQQKGGVGKTTIAAHLAVALTQSGGRVLLLDIDPQGSLTHWHGLREKRFGVGYTGITFNNSVGWKLNITIDQSKNKYDYLVIDSPPHTEIDSKAAIRAADLVLVPMQASPTDVWATSTTLDFIAGEKKLAKIILNRYNPSSKTAKEVISNVPNLLSSYLGNRVAFSSCFMHGITVVEAEPNSQAAFEVRQLTDAVLLALRDSN